ncbi:hypothetical protein F441_03495 [Phytophthora nicotianae CJ01A1]|uniref:Uncharacterized protein n=6 Tax=Phytophthora nicotianae TaxID=4792 RepID=W2ZWP3_PHYNI|nr:hypothetical protein PPTG_22241 [Phytophthora nicotianae INRA-310]ETI53608.1 hypothetical protein F443_03518 [Phytophthora nicotianae P1569]ETM31394.1 hypothetical protein L914_21020 [Phytophthora nicotianae]ETO82264.1 hypothetical protein F444_03560 [Phytophthora nicotianae P1976]ETP23406.1 hypothetical protein F441_03495 [Phytophthora nicotianae CJ01A1]ETP29008.1 hypothetical protein F442_21747 [Phytophthora nicotianae P10297]
MVVLDGVHACTHAKVSFSPVIRNLSAGSNTPDVPSPCTSSDWARMRRASRTQLRVRKITNALISSGRGDVRVILLFGRLSWNAGPRQRGAVMRVHVEQPAVTSLNPVVFSCERKCADTVDI